MNRSIINNVVVNLLGLERFTKTDITISETSSGLLINDNAKNCIYRIDINDAKNRVYCEIVSLFISDVDKLQAIIEDMNFLQQVVDVHVEMYADEKIVNAAIIDACGVFKAHTFFEDFFDDIYMEDNALLLLNGPYSFCVEHMDGSYSVQLATNGKLYAFDKLTAAIRLIHDIMDRSIENERKKVAL